MREELTIPMVGENVESIQVVKTLVDAGDLVKKDQPILELETGKAVVEVPSTRDGKVIQLFLNPGDDVEVGQPILTLETDEAEETPQGEDGESPSEESVADESKPSDAENQPTDEEEKPSTSETSEDEGTPSVSSTPPEERQPSTPSTSEGEGKSSTPSKLVPASPSTRRFAREIGVDVNRVKGTGPHGRVSKDDVKRYARETRSGSGGAMMIPEPPSPDFSRWGPIRVEKMSAIRRQTAGHLTICQTVIPHVTIHDKADITALEPLRKKYANRAEELDGKLTMAVMVTKVAASALKRFPKLNASVDLRNNKIIFKEYCHVGVAVATERGLVVPVIRDADQKNMVELAAEITAIAKRAREGRLSADDMSGGTFTVTNLGRVGGTFFTPIVNHPEVGILGMGRYSLERDPDGDDRRTMLPLSLSFDHRLVDGVEAAAFMNWIIEALKEPLLLSLEG